MILRDTPWLLYVCVGFPQVSLKWSSDRAHPGEQVSLTVTAAEPRFQVGIVVMGTQSDAPWTDLDFRAEQV